VLRLLLPLQAPRFSIMSNNDDEGKGADTGSEPITIRVRDQVSRSDRVSVLVCRWRSIRCTLSVLASMRAHGLSWTCA
jgi:hypothetical protein